MPVAIDAGATRAYQPACPARPGPTCTTAAATSNRSATTPSPRGASTLFEVHKGGELCSGSIKVRGVRFNFDVRCGDNKVVYVQTLDPNFVTTDGLRVGATLAATVEAGGVLLENERCGVLLPSGWTARPEIDLSSQLPAPEGCGDPRNQHIAYFDRH